MKALRFALLLFAISAPALAGSSSTLVATRNSEIVAQAPLAKDVFVVEGDGAIRHLQSGILCAAGFQSVNFADVRPEMATPELKSKAIVGVVMPPEHAAGLVILLTAQLRNF